MARHGSAKRPGTHWIDITAALGPKTPVFPGDSRVEVAVDSTPGEPARVTTLRLSAHAGTHADAPNHLRGGRGGVETIPLGSLIGPALVHRSPRGRPIDAEAIARLPRTAPPRILFRGSPVILPEAARAMIRRRFLLVGTDGLSIDPIEQRTLPSHRLLLRAGLVVLEGLNLSRAAAGRYHLIALPLLIPGADGAPVRAVLRK